MRINFIGDVESSRFTFVCLVAIGAEVVDVCTELGFRSNVFVDIALYLKGKLKAMDIYASEMAPFPFPLSHEVLRTLAKMQGAASGYHAAEAFQLLRERS